MSRNDVQGVYVRATENIENRDAATLRVKDAEVRETRVPVQGNRAALRTLTNNITNVAVQPRQVQMTF